MICLDHFKKMIKTGVILKPWNRTVCTSIKFYIFGIRDDSIDSYRYPTLSEEAESSFGMTEFRLCQLSPLSEPDLFHLSLLTESEFCHPGHFCHPGRIPIFANISMHNYIYKKYGLVDGVFF